MHSLTNTYAADEVVAWAARGAPPGVDGGPPPALVADLQVDGVTLSLRYVDGVLASAATSGDGTTGDDVAANVRAVLVDAGSVPAALPPAAAAAAATRVAVAVMEASGSGGGSGRGGGGAVDGSVVVDIRGEV